MDVRKQLVVFLCLCLVADAAPAFQEVTVLPGQTLTFLCRGDSTNIGVLLNRTDLRSGQYVFLYKDNRQDPTYQNPTFQGRVFLKDGWEQGDLSLNLTNVTNGDSGDYECQVFNKDTDGDVKNITTYIVVKVLDSGGRTIIIITAAVTSAVITVVIVSVIVFKCIFKNMWNKKKYNVSDAENEQTLFVSQT